jgi:charged multivesicular body protein 7
VEAMRAGADALKSLNEKVGGAEGVQGVVDAVNEQMATTEEITNIINETDSPLDETEIDDEFEALERAEKEKLDQEAAAKTASRLAILEEADKKRRAKEREEKAKQLQEEAKKKAAETQVDEASQGLANISFHQPEDDEEMKDADKEERIPVPS